MSFADAVRILNSLKRRRVIRDYVLIGSVAATFYMEPMFTQDLDVIVLAESDDEYVEMFRRVAQFAEGQEGMHYTLGGVPVQIFPSTIKPLYLDTLKNARQARIGNIRVKVASPEHLILLSIEAFRAKDKLRIQQLLSAVDMGRLTTLLERFDDEESTLAQRLQSLL